MLRFRGDGEMEVEGAVKGGRGSGFKGVTLAPTLVVSQEHPHATRRDPSRQEVVDSWDWRSCRRTQRSVHPGRIAQPPP